ncbi:MAG: hypothetical protein ACP6IS_08530 [Candidatus Asgardarchaeia archaeon]
MKNSLVVRELIRGIALDSSKHANLMRGLIGMLESKTPFLTEEQRDKLSENIK